MTATLDRALLLAADRLDGIGDEPSRKRHDLVEQCPTPLDLAARFDQTIVRTPALELLSTRLAETARAWDGRLVISIPPQEGKALDCDTPILTTAGWSTMGDLQVGDEVFHPDGHPTRVVGAFPVMHGHRCYRVTTTDGRSIVADAEHLWTVRDRSRRGGGKGNAPAPWETVTTEQLIERGVLAENGRRANGTPHRAYRFGLPRQHEIVSKPVDLPIDPYVLGAWLGDGDTSGAGFTSADPEIPEQIRAAGYTVTPNPKVKYRWYINRGEARSAAKAEALQLAETGMSLREAYRRVGLPIGTNLVVGGRTKGQHSLVPIDPSKWVPRIKSFREDLRDLGVLDNKHIPDAYLTAGAEQRLALLQGLMDTDGTITSNKTSRRAVFSVCNQQLAEGTLYLARSLGWRATIREGVAKLNGRVIGPKWNVAFTAEQGQHVPFRLRRKAELIQAPQSRGGELYAVSIASVEPVESRPVRCIKVDREDGLFLAGRGLMATHNTTLLRWFFTWLLFDDPNRRNVLASYAAGLARGTGRIVRSNISTHGAEYGLTVARDHADASDWQLSGFLGGTVTTGVGGSLTGKPADLLAVDDPLRNQADADSSTIRSNLHDWWSSVARTRLAPGAPVVIVQTRWVEDDLAGRMETEGWPVLNIPALSDGKTPDALGRAPGVWLESARGRTAADWENTRKDVGERTWAALYQGRPAPLEGGVFKTAWFDIWRVPELPAGCLPPVVVVDPADNEGDGDEAGIIVGAQHPASGKVFIVDDLSASMTVARWARLALLTCVRRQAPTLVFERSLSQLPSRIREAWTGLHREAMALRAAGGDQDAAVTRLLRRDDGPDVRAHIEKAVAEVAPDVDEILGFGSTGPRLKALVAKGSKQVRMQLVAPMFETGRAVMVGRHTQLEHVASTWQPGMDSPDRVDAMTHLCAYAGGTATVSSIGRSTDRVPTNSTSLRNKTSSRITRSTRR